MPVVAVLAAVLLVAPPAFAAGVEPPGDGGAEPGSADEVVVEIRADGMQPELVTVPVGATVVWHHVATSPHALRADDGSFDSHPACRPPDPAGCLAPSQEFRRVFDQAGTHRYRSAGVADDPGDDLVGVVVVDEVPGPDPGCGTDPPQVGTGDDDAGPVDRSAGTGVTTPEAGGTVDPLPPVVDDGPPGSEGPIDTPVHGTDGGPGCAPDAPPGGGPGEAPPPTSVPPPATPAPDRPVPDGPRAPGAPPTDGAGGPGSAPDEGVGAPPPTPAVPPAAASPPSTPGGPPPQLIPVPAEAARPAVAVPAVDRHAAPFASVVARPAFGSALAVPPGFPAHLRALMESVVRTPANSTARLVAGAEALRAAGIPHERAIAVAFGRFPVGAAATYSHDWWFPRSGLGWRLHQGTDIFAERGAPVRAPAAGVVSVSHGGLGGLSVRVTEADGTYWYLAHLASVAPGLTPGEAVAVGDVVGTVGDSGNARGGLPHLHIEWHPGGGPAVDLKAVLDGFIAEAEAGLDGAHLRGTGVADDTMKLSGHGTLSHGRPMSFVSLLNGSPDDTPDMADLFGRVPTGAAHLTDAVPSSASAAVPGSHPELAVAAAALVCGSLEYRWLHSTRPPDRPGRRRGIRRAERRRRLRTAPIHRTVAARRPA